MHLDYRAHDRQAQTRSRGARLVRLCPAVEAFEDVRQLGGVDAYARIGYAQLSTVSGGLERHPNFAAAWRELDCVAQQVAQYLAHPLRIVGLTNRLIWQHRHDPDALPICGGV